MTAILVHGVPDTYRVWDGVRKHLGRSDIKALALPGFGVPRPAGFHSRKEEYVDWLTGVLEKEDGPVDLVGHDWGCMLVARVASLRPDLVRTWAAGNGPVSAAWRVPAVAKIWQTPTEGEKWMAELDPAAFAAELATTYKVPIYLAQETAARMDATMKDSILRLYRSAVQVGQEWEPGLSKASSPGFVFWGVSDTAAPIEFADRLGAATGSEVLHMPCGHWPLLEKPAQLASALERHWSSSQSR
jgi:pimeloyl-ACP methyl ester carboxylesterase